MHKFLKPHFDILTHTYWTTETKEKQLYSPSNLLSMLYGEKFKDIPKIYAENGTQGHKILENFMNGTNGNLKMKIWGYQNSIQDAINRLTYIKTNATWYQTELRTCNESNAGTIDLVVYQKNIVHIIDYKFSKNYNKTQENNGQCHNYHSFQIYAYYQILKNQFPQGTIFKGYVWYINKEQFRQIIVDLEDKELADAFKVMNNLPLAINYIDQLLYKKWYVKEGE